MEATGGYETLLVKCLAKHAIDAAVLNPRQVRDFAKGIVLDAKTDPIDAQLISKFASVVKSQAMPMASDHEQKHSALVARRCQLLELINQENNRLKQSWDDDVKKSIREVLESLKKQLKSLDSQLAKMLEMDTENKRTIEILQSVKGIGPVTISTLVAIRHNPAIKAFYTHLTGKGKESKVAIVACMRKLITILNLRIKTDQL